MTKKKIYIILMILIAGGFLWYFLKNQEAEKEYITAMAQKTSIKKTVSATGKIIPQKEINLSPQISGQIISLFVEVGDEVREGQKIAEINKGHLPNQLIEARHELDAQKRLLANMKRREDTYNYFQKEAQRETIEKMKVALEEIERQIRMAYLYSPLDGFVIEKNLEIGEMAISGSPIMTVASKGDLQIEVEISESDIAEIKIGQKVEISLDAFWEEEKLVGEIFEIEPASTVIQDVVYYKAKIRLEEQRKNLKIGMSVNGKIKIEEKNNIVVVPARAVRSEEKNNFVEILEEENQVKKVFVETGISGDEGMIEVTRGLSEGEKVIISASEK